MEKELFERGVEAFESIAASLAALSSAIVTVVKEVETGAPKKTEDKKPAEDKKKAGRPAGPTKAEDKKKPEYALIDLKTAASRYVSRRVSAGSGDPKGDCGSLLAHHAAGATKTAEVDPEYYAACIDAFNADWEPIEPSSEEEI